MDTISEEDEFQASIDASPEESEMSLATSSDDVAPVDDAEDFDNGAEEESEPDECNADNAQTSSSPLPAMSPYKRPASNTPRKVMGMRLHFSLRCEPTIAESLEEAQGLINTTDTSISVEDTSSYAFYALENWSVILGHDDNIEVPPSPIPDLADMPTLAGPGSSTATPSEVPAGLVSTETSSTNTRATTPQPASIKTVRDVVFAPTRPSKSSKMKSAWGKVKEKLSRQQSEVVPKTLLKEKKGGFGKLVKGFLRGDLRVWRLWARRICETDSCRVGLKGD